jgi:citrate lyase subunit beta/citryl-CoA lyase
MSRKSFLFVPGNRPARFDKACAAGADMVIVDLEDAVGAAEKDSARTALREWLAPERQVYVRVNGADTAWFGADLEILSAPGIAGVVLPKSESAADIAAVRAAAKQVPVLPLIETAVGLWKAEEIARAKGVERLAFGSVDFQLDLSISGEEQELLFARSQLVLVSRVAGILPPIDGVTVDIDDPNILHAEIARSRKLGFGGKLAIHPKQVAAINDGFAPQPAEVEWARRVVEAADAAGDNAVRLDGKLIDIPVIGRARAILAAAGGQA